MHKVKKKKPKQYKQKNILFFSPLLDGGCEWYVCEGFQLVLKKQAEALEALGVCPQMKVRRYQCEFYTHCVYYKRRYFKRS